MPTYSDPFSKEPKDVETTASEDRQASNLGEKVREFCKSKGSATICIINRRTGDHRWFDFELDAKGRFKHPGAHNNLCILNKEKSPWRIATVEEEKDCKAKDKAEAEAILKQRSDVHKIAIELASQVFVQNAAEQAAKTVSETQTAISKKGK